MAEVPSSVSHEAEATLAGTPRFRGRLHQAALIVAVPASARLVALAPPGEVRLATAVYALSLVGLFAASSAYHRLNWSPAARRLLRSLDHSMIFLLIAGTYSAFGMLVLHGRLRLVVLAVVWAGALVGVTVKLINVDQLSWLGGTLYIVLGWLGILALPQVLSEAEGLPISLTLVGGVLYTAGATVLLRRRPDPNPLVFGYHEVWHALVVVASACHYAAIALLLEART